MVAWLLRRIHDGIENSRLDEKNVKITQLVSVYRKAARFALQPTRIEFANRPDFGLTATASIPLRGELLSHLILAVELPDIYTKQLAAIEACGGTSFGSPGTCLGPFFTWTNNPGHALIQAIHVSIGGYTLDSLTGEQLEVLDELYTPFEQWSAVNRSLGRVTSGFTQTSLSQLDKVFIPLSALWFSRHWLRALPVDAMNADRIDIQVTFRPLNELYYTASTPATDTLDALHLTAVGSNWPMLNVPFLSEDESGTIPTTGIAGVVQGNDAVSNTSVAGLTRRFWDNIALSGEPDSTTVASEVINYSLGVMPLASDVATSDAFSYQWVGWLVPPESGNYKLRIDQDDNAIVWFDETLVIDSWNAEGGISDWIALTADQAYRIRIDYRNNVGGSNILLSWYTPSAPTTITPIPASTQYISHTTSPFDTVLTYTGAVQTFTVPDSVTSITVRMWGAGGASAKTAQGMGGAGAFVSGTMAVTAGDTYRILVGQGGSQSIAIDTVGFGGGGARSSLDGAAGGGRSAIQKLVSGEWVDWVVAGGGGGAGDANSAHGGGGGIATGQRADGVYAATVSNEYAGGGSQSAGGEAGGGTAVWPGEAGTAGVGGTGVGLSGAGGGGYYGGGSAAYDDAWAIIAGGSGGSSYIANLTSPSTDPADMAQAGSLQNMFRLFHVGEGGFGPDGDGQHGLVWISYETDPVPPVMASVVSNVRMPASLSIPNAYLYGQYVYLDPRDAAQIRSANLQFPVERHVALQPFRVKDTGVARIPLDTIPGLVTELTWVFRRVDATAKNAHFLWTRDLNDSDQPVVWWPRVRTSAARGRIESAWGPADGRASEPMTRARLLYGGRFTRFDHTASFFRSHVPSRYYAKPALVGRYVYAYNFSDAPTSPLPHGHANFDLLQQKVLELTLNPAADGTYPEYDVLVFATTLTVFRSFGGRGTTLW
jgi:hypothetical protein